MKFADIFDLVQDASDLTSFFDGVTSPEQLVSRLERLKKSAVDDLLANVFSLRQSIDGMLNSTLELGGSSIEDSDDLSDTSSTDDNLGDLLDDSSPWVKPENASNNSETSSETTPARTIDQT